MLTLEIIKSVFINLRYSHDYTRNLDLNYLNYAAILSTSSGKVNLMLHDSTFMGIYRAINI